MRLHRSDFSIGRLGVTWLDRWTHSYGLEIVWGERVLLDLGFRSGRHDD